jgi:protein FRA10AC1
VLSGAGETTCANTRCEHHHQSKAALSTLELPFAYEEHGEAKSALVKVVLCDRCVRKLMWKRNKDRERAIKLEKDLDHSLRAEGSKRKSLDDSGEDGGRKEAELERPSEHRDDRKRRRCALGQ